MITGRVMHVLAAFLYSHNPKTSYFSVLDSSLHVLSQRETEICVSGQVMGEVEKQDSLGSNSRSVFELRVQGFNHRLYKLSSPLAAKIYRSQCWDSSASVRLIKSRAS